MERWNLERYHAELNTGKASKYHNVKTQGYASKKEARRARDLKHLVRAGQISDLIEQPSFKFEGLTYDNGRTVTYIADFEYIEDGQRIIEDVKSEGTKTAVYRLKKALMRKYYGIEIRET